MPRKCQSNALPVTATVAPQLSVMNCCLHAFLNVHTPPWQDTHICHTRTWTTTSILCSGAHMWRAIVCAAINCIKERQILLCRWCGCCGAPTAIWLAPTQRQTMGRGSCVCFEVDDKHNGWLTYVGNPHGAGGMKQIEKKKVIISSVISSFNTVSSNTKCY